MEISKEREIQILTELCESDSYFSQFFKNDFEQMIDNIRKDFAIESGTSFGAKKFENQRIQSNFENFKNQLKYLFQEISLILTNLEISERQHNINLSALKKETKFALDNLRELISLQD